MAAHTGTVEVFNYVHHVETFRVNGQEKDVPAASIRRVFDLFGRLLSQETIPGKAIEPFSGRDYQN